MAVRSSLDENSMSGGEVRPGFMCPATASSERSSQYAPLIYIKGASPSLYQQFVSLDQQYQHFLFRSQ